jgi:hypothetical protein
MPKKYKFGKLSVSCEGYAYPDDPYILAGSCGVSNGWTVEERCLTSSSLAGIPLGVD